MIDFITPTEWGARVDYDLVDWNPWNPDKWVIHYGGGSNTEGRDPAAVLRAWERYHIDTRGWLGLAYNYAIGQDGSIFRVRGENRAGATSGDVDNDGIPANHEARAVVFIIGGDQEPTEAALDAFRTMYHTMQPGVPVFVHKDFTDTACPGPHLSRLVAEEFWVPQVSKTRTKGQWQVSIQHAEQWAESKGAHPRFIELASAVWEISAREFIRPEVTYALMALETAYGHYGGQVLPQQNNWGGLKTRDGSGFATFDSARMGVRAVVEHLALYAGDFIDNPVDPRHFDSIRGKAKTIEDLSNNWSGADYGEKVKVRYDNLLSFVPVDPDCSDVEMRLKEAQVALQQTKVLLDKTRMEKNVALTERDAFRAKLAVVRNKVNEIKEVVGD